MKPIIPAAFDVSSYQNELQGGKPVSVKEPVDLNKALHLALNSVQGVIETSQIIIRCDQLPVTEGNAADFQRLFNTVMQLVLSQSPVGSKQFLYIKCEEEEVEKEVMAVLGDTKFYIIQFHSNIVLGTYWQAAYRAPLSDCEQIAKTYNGSFAYAHLHSGSLFTLRLPAKSL